MDLPVEILISIFSFLEPEDLENVPLVCKSWHSLVGDPVWRQMFIEQFGTTDITPICTEDQQFSWHREIVTRRHVLKKWRYRKVKALSYNPGIHDISNLYTNFDSCRIVAYNRVVNASANFEMPINLLGRVREYGEYRATASAVDGSGYAILYGYSNGKMEILSASKRGLQVAQTYFHSHNSSISSVWLSKKEHPTKHRGITCASGGFDGKVILTNAFEKKNTIHKVSRVAILQLTCTDNSVLALDANGDLFGVFDEDEEAILLIKASDAIGVAGIDSKKCQLYFSSGYAIVRYERHLLRVSLETREIATFFRPRDDSNATITAVAFDNTPRKGHKYLCCASSDDTLQAWCIDAVAEDGLVPPAWSNTIPGVLDIAVNPIIVITADTLGRRAVLDVLSGSYLRYISIQFSRQVLNFSTLRVHPTVRLELDNTDLMTPGGILSVGPAVQLFSVGRDLDLEQQSQRQPRRHRGSRGSGPRLSTAQHDINDEVIEELERQSQPPLAVQDYVIGDMHNHEDQIAYALSISQEDETDEDAALRRALELSHLDEPSTDSNGAHNDSVPILEVENGAEHVEDEDLRLALEISLQDEQPDSLPVNDTQSQYDRDLEEAIALSLQE